MITSEHLYEKQQPEELMKAVGSVCLGPGVLLGGGGELSSVDWPADMPGRQQSPSQHGQRRALIASN